MRKSSLVGVVLILIIFNALSPTGLWAQKSDPVNDLDKAFVMVKKIESLAAWGKKDEFLSMYNDFIAILGRAQKSVSDMEKKLGPLHPETARNINKLGDLFSNIEQYKQAGSLYKRALAIREKVLGPEHPDTVLSLNNLAEIYRKTHSYDKAEPLYRRALAIREKTLGSEHPDTASSLSNLALLYDAMHSYDKAEPLYRRALAIREKTLGPEHPDTATSLNNLAVLYYHMDMHDKAEPLYRRALAIREKTLGPEHPDTAIILNNLAVLYERAKAYDRAETFFRRALDIREKTLGPMYPSTTNSMKKLARIYKKMGSYDKAEQLYQRTLALSEKFFGPRHPDTAKNLNNLAGLYYDLGAYDKAESLYQRALDIREKVLGPEHRKTVYILNDLALVYEAMGSYDRAEIMNKRALAIREKTLGPMHQDTAASLNNLAGLYVKMGAYDKAKPLLKKALEIFEKVLGPMHPNTASSLSQLASFHRYMGDFSQAESLYKRALAIREKAFGPEHHKTANSLNNLALLYWSMRKYSQAETLLKRALAIEEKVLGPMHFHTAIRLNNLALVYYSMGDYDQAEPLFKRALEIFEKVLGPMHPNTASNLNELANLYRRMGAYSQAEPLFKRALAIREKALGPQHMKTGESLNNLANLYAAQSDYEKALSLFKQAQEISNSLIDQVFSFTNEKRKMNFLATQKTQFAQAMGLAAFHLGRDPNARQDALNWWLRRKGVVLEAQKRLQEAMIYGDDPQLLEWFQEMSQLRTRLSKLTFGGPGKRGLENYNTAIASLKKQINDLEAKLAGKSASFAREKKVRLADAAQVARRLPAKSTLLEFAKIRPYNFQAKGKEKRWKPAHYLTFILPAGKEGRVELVDLGPAKPIDKAVSDFKGILVTDPGEGDRDAAKQAQQLYELIFAKIKDALGETREIFISPDGDLNLVPFEVLQGPDGRYLIEDYTFTYLTAGRDLLGFGEAKSDTGPPLFMGNPEFDLGLKEEEQALTRLALNTTVPPSPQRAKDMRGPMFSPLPGTEKEIEEIKQLFKADNPRVYTREEALEKVLRSMAKPPRILHLATHGFFLKDIIWTDMKDLPTITDSNGNTYKVLNKQTSVNPLLRSGLALAGANRALASDDPNQSDGLLTAEKILGLKLWGTELVVLSACETGLGEVKIGEGVYGLRRAFIQAGAKGLVMSMWSVPDRETQELMVQFYKNIQSGKMNRCQALRQAMLKQKEIVRKRYGHTHPLFWGAFVYLGQP